MSTGIILVDRVKQHLKNKGITYAQLALKLEVSESTLKRWFSSKNFSLSQLDQICKHTGLTFEDLARNNIGNNAQKYFTAEQESLFAKEEKLLVIFYLVASGKNIDDIKDNYEFSGSEIESAFLKMEKLALIELYPGNKVFPKMGLSTMWIPKGRLSQKYFRLIREEFMNSYFNTKNEDQHFLSGRLTNESIKIIQKKIDKLSLEIQELYQLDANDKNAQNISMFFGFRPFSFSILEKFKR